MYKLERPLELISNFANNQHGVCPFCGNNNNALTLSEDRNLYWIYCKNCHADGPSKTTTVEAIKAWQILNINKE